MSRPESYLLKSKFFRQMMPSDKQEVEERKNDFIWFGDHGIFHSVPKEGEAQSTVSEVKEEVKNWETKYGKQKVCMISVVNPHVKMTREFRDYMRDISPKYVTAFALINDSILGRVAVNMFVGMKKPPYPVKNFKDYQSAMSWIEQYATKS